MIDYFLKGLNEKQIEVCKSTENLLITACPGSGKTRTLTHKIGYILDNSKSMKRIVAITYTNRAAYEIIDRLEKMGVDCSRVWVGTIHQFCLDFVLRRFKMYNPNLSKGFRIIDERASQKYLKDIADTLNIKIPFDNPINTRRNRNLNLIEKNKDYLRILEIYYKKLKSNHEIDFDLILAHSYRLLRATPHINDLIKNSIEFLCVDEYQDTQDLQYAIIEQIYNCNTNKIQINFFGDPNQTIFETLGGLSKKIDELNNEFYDSSFKQMVLDGCYRTPQNIIDYYSKFMIEKYQIFSLKEGSIGNLQFINDIDSSNLANNVAKIVKYHIDKGVKPQDICIIAPTWALLYEFSKKIKILLPNVPFDSPDITPIKRDPMSVFYNMCYLILTKPSFNRLNTRMRIAKEIISKLEIYLNIEVEGIDLLNFINSNNVKTNSGTEYIRESIDRILKFLCIELNKNSNLLNEYNDFFSKIAERLNNVSFNLTDDISDFKNMFLEKNGVVVNTLHGVKGEEYEVVIAFGLLESKIPSIFTPVEIRDQVALKLLFVTASRTKKYLYLISEKRKIKRYGSYVDDKVSHYL